MLLGYQKVFSPRILAPFHFFGCKRAWLPLNWEHTVSKTPNNSYRAVLAATGGHLGLDGKPILLTTGVQNR